jgi:hypothetical protein
LSAETVRDLEVAGSNPACPTSANFKEKAGATGAMACCSRLFVYLLFSLVSSVADVLANTPLERGSNKLITAVNIDKVMNASGDAAVPAGSYTLSLHNAPLTAAVETKYKEPVVIS